MSLKTFIKKKIEYLKNVKKILTHGGIVNIQFNNVTSMNSLEGKVALITGATSGFGLAIAKQYLANGAKVIITGRSESKLLAALNELDSSNAKGIIWDICNLDIIDSKLEEASKLFGDLDIIINNAGVWTGKEWNEITEKDWDFIVDTNAKALFFMCQAEVKAFSGSASLKKIINITSMEGVLGGFGPYYASKWAANGITRGLAKKFTGRGIIINAIAPGPSKTNINKDYFKGQEGNFYNPDCRSYTGRMVLVEEVAGLAAFLASDQANSIIGQVIVIDGGISLL